MPTFTIEMVMAGGQAFEAAVQKAKAKALSGDALIALICVEVYSAMVLADTRKGEVVSLPEQPSS